MYAAFTEGMDRTGTVLHATAGCENSLTVQEIAERIVEITRPRCRTMLMRPYMRVVADKNDPLVWASNAKDEKIMRRLQWLAHMFSFNKIARQLERVADGIPKIPRVFMPFTHNEYNFCSRVPLKEYMPQFEKLAYMKLAIAGVNHHLIGCQEEPIEAAGLRDEALKQDLVKKVDITSTYSYVLSMIVLMLVSALASSHAGTLTAHIILVCVLFGLWVMAVGFLPAVFTSLNRGVGSHMFWLGEALSLTTMFGIVPLVLMLGDIDEYAVLQLNRKLFRGLDTSKDVVHIQCAQERKLVGDNVV